MMNPNQMPLQLMMAMMQSQLSNGISGGWNAGLPNWNAPWMDMFSGLMPKPQSPAEQWLNQLQSLVQSQSEQLKSQQKSSGDAWSGMQAEAQRRAQDFAVGAEAFMATPPPEYTPTYPVIWQRGNARLLDIAPENSDGPAVLFIPSLINTARVLDLSAEDSVVRQLAEAGMRPMILDWGAPGPDEEGFACADYITAYALDALDNARAAHDGPLLLAGYCMGGIFATAIAQIAEFWVDGLILFATPWDFSAEDAPVVLLNPATQTLLRQWFAQQPMVPEWVLQGIFHLIDPWALQRKYARFPSLSAEEKRRFVAVEHWANHAIPLTREVANEVFVDWPQDNVLANHQWKVGRHWMEPAEIKCPTLAFIPKNDRIVPTGCALPLAKAIPKCSILQPDAGHVSMLVGADAKTHSISPLVKWVRAHF